MVAAAPSGTSSTARQYRFSYTPFWKPIFTFMGMGPKHMNVEVDSFQVRVRAGWSFSMTIPRDQIASVTPAKKPFGLGIGVHSWRGRWVVNGSNNGIVRIVLKTPQSARMMGFPIKPRELFLSLEYPLGFIAALGTV